MLQRIYITFEENENSRQKDVYEYFYKKDDEIKRTENEGIVKYGNDLINCKKIHSKGGEC